MIMITHIDYLLIVKTFYAIFLSTIGDIKLKISGFYLKINV